MIIYGHPLTLGKNLVKLGFMTDTLHSAGRQPSEIDKICDRYIDDLAQLDPTSGSFWGYPGLGDKWFDVSPAGLDEQIKLESKFRNEISSAPVQDQVDAITVEAIKDRTEVSLKLHDMGEYLCKVDNISSPLQSVRDTFSMMPTATESDAADIAARLHKIPEVLRGYVESLRLASKHGKVAARRQIDCGIDQSRALLEEDSFFDEVVSTVLKAQPDLPESLVRDLYQGVVDAKDGYRELSGFLAAKLRNIAPEEDAVGRERYEVFSHEFVGARVDLDEAYEWGREELAKIDAQQRELAVQLYGPGTTPQEAMKRLDEEERYTLHGVDALKAWMQKTADKAIADLHGTHFDIPEQVRTIECMIDPAGTGGIFYTGPADDFSRPGRMWWSVPPGEDTFHTWQELTTVFHEGVPGHHLQIGTTTWNRAELNKWRRLGCWNSGHGEGWALYSEELMAELGYQDDPGNRFGMLDGQRLRAVRVMLDIGVHLGKEVPEGGKVWDYDYAWQFLKKNVAMADGFLRFELDRYLGWPGQAPSYKLGQRLWQQLRDEYLAKAPELGLEPTLKAFHARALPLGSLPMATLRSAVLSNA